jgi:hypothetical protein
VFLDFSPFGATGDFFLLKLIVAPRGAALNSEVDFRNYRSHHAEHQKK